MQLFGFVVIMLGTLGYNEILRIPCLGFSDSIEKRRFYMKNRTFNLNKGYDTGNSIGVIEGAIFDYTDFKEVTGIRNIINVSN